MKVIFYASQLLLCINLIFYKCQNSTKLCRDPDSCTLILLVLILSALPRVLPFPVACLLPHCSALFHLSVSSHPPLSLLPFFSSSSVPPYSFFFFDRSPFVSLPSHSAYWHSWRDLSLSLSHSVSLIALILLSICLSPYLPPSVSIFTSLPHSPSFPPSLSSSSLAISPCTLDSFYTLRKHPSFCSVEEKSLLFFPFSLKKKKTRNSIFHFSSLRLSSLSQLLHSPVDPILKLEPICFIFSWSSWQGPFCWRTTLSTQTRSPCTSRASSALTKLTPSRTQDQKKTARLHLSSSTLSSPPYPLWRWVCFQLKFKKRYFHMWSSCTHAHISYMNIRDSHAHNIHPQHVK